MQYMLYYLYISSMVGKYFYYCIIECQSEYILFEVYTSSVVIQIHQKIDIISSDCKLNTSNFLYYCCSLFNSIPSTCKYVGIQFLNRVIVVYYKYVYIYTKCPLKLHSIYIWYNVVLHDKQDQAFLVELFIDIIKAIFFSTIYYMYLHMIQYYAYALFMNF